MNKVDYKVKVISLLSEKELTLEDKRKLEAIFPQLKEEYESDRIREMLISFVKHDAIIASEKNKQDALDWLEQQGKEKITDFVDYKEAIDYIVRHYVIPDEVDDELHLIAEGKWKLNNKDREQINQICVDLHNYAHYVRGKDSYEAKRLEKESDWLRSIKEKICVG